jgi:Kef-type K+ transport system membrane component KefB
VAAVGVAVPLAAGFMGARLLLPAGTPLLVALFAGACLSATSIGISARVLKEHGAGISPEGRVIVGAAVLDDVLGLLLLTFVTGAVAAAGDGSRLPWGPLVLELLLAVGFLAAALGAGRYLTPHLFRLANRFRSHQVLLPAALGFAFLLAYLGTLAGLAAIVGAYAAGLILEPAHVQMLEERELRPLEDLVQPLVVVLSPIFFVVMGARVDLFVLFAPRTLLLAAVLGILGVLGKLAAGWAAGGRLRPSVIGWGMVPRGEVGLVFVATGALLRLGDAPVLSAHAQAGIIGAIFLTTVAGPLGLDRTLRRRGRLIVEVERRRPGPLD